MAVAVLQPLLDTVDSKLGYEEKERYLHEIKSVYGETYSKQSDFRSTLNLLARENKINIENTRILEDFVAGSKNEQEIKYELEKFKHENREEISKYQLERESKDFIGRDVNELEKKVNLHAGVILWGASGVGKTKFAEQMLKSWKGEAIKIDLRGLDTMGLIYVATLESFGKPVRIDDASISLVNRVVSSYPKNKNTILLFDNADDFIKSSEDQDELADGFAEMLKGIISISNRKIKIIATSREKSMHPLAVDNFYQEELTPLEFKDSSSMIDKGMIHGRENDALIKKATEYCQNHPLNLKILAARLQELGCSLEDILQHIEKEAKKWKKQNENTTKADQFTFGVISERFNRLSDTMQLGAVALSLFRRSFSLVTVGHVVKSFSSKKLSIILESLRKVNLISLEDNENMIYDMHPRVREFLQGNTELKHIKQFYMDTKQCFLIYYKDYLVSVSHLIDSNYLEGYTKYQEEVSNLDFFLKNVRADFFLYESYDDLQLVAPFVTTILDPHVRLEFFTSLAKQSLQRGMKRLGTLFLCQAALCQMFFDPHSKFTVNATLQIEHILNSEQMRNIAERRTKDFIEIEALYYHVKGLRFYHITHSNHNIDDCNTAITASRIGLTLREKLYPDGHTDLVHSYITTGNGYNMKKDLCEKKSKEWRESVKLALEYYEKALEISRHIYKSDLHFDVPQIYENIGTIQHQYEKYDDAERSFKKALEIEKEMKLDGLFNTTTKLVNLGALYQRLRKGDEAFECYRKATEIRKSLKGPHKDTVLTIYRMAEIKRLVGNFSEAVEYYKEAFEMEETLPSNYHSSVREKIRIQLIKCMEMSLKRERRSSEDKNEYKKQLSMWQERFKKLEKEEKSAASTKRMEITPSHATGSEPMEIATEQMVDEPEDIEMVEPTNNVDLRKSVSYLVDETGGFVECASIGVYLTIAKGSFSKLLTVEINRINQSDANLRLKSAEFLVSDVINISAESRNLKSPNAVLEIPCHVTQSAINKYSEVFVIGFNAADNRWCDIEHFEILFEDCDWHGSVKRYPVVHAFITSFTNYAVILRPIADEFTIGQEAKKFTLHEDEEDITLQFPPNAFTPEAECKCTVKAFSPSKTLLLDSESSHNFIIPCPIVSIETSSKLLMKPVTIKLPLIERFPGGEGRLFILKSNAESANNWIDVTEAVKFIPSEEKFLNFEVTSFSWYVAVWVKDLAYNVVVSTVNKLFNLSFDATFHLYKKCNTEGERFPIGISCVPWTSNEDDHHDMKMKPQRDNKYYYIDSQPSKECIIDSEIAHVNVIGEFHNAMESLEKRQFRLKKSFQEPSKFRVHKNRDGNIDNDNCVEIRRQENDQLLCSLFYDGEFYWASSKSPFRFLGLQLENCGLNDINLASVDVTTRFHLAGIHESFETEIKNVAQNKSWQMATKMVLNHLTNKFRCRELPRDWFRIFELVWPEHARRRLNKVLQYLDGGIRGESKISIIRESILEDEDVHLLLRCFAKVFLNRTIKSATSGGIISDTRQQSRKDCEAILHEYLKQNITFFQVLQVLLSIDEYESSVQRILDRMGNRIERYLGFVD